MHSPRLSEELEALVRRTRRNVRPALPAERQLGSRADGVSGDARARHRIRGHRCVRCERIERRLVSIPPPIESVSATTWRNHIGRRESYAALLAFFVREIDVIGMADDCSAVSARVDLRLGQGCLSSADSLGLRHRVRVDIRDRRRPRLHDHHRRRSGAREHCAARCFEVDGRDVHRLGSVDAGSALLARPIQRSLPTNRRRRDRTPPGSGEAGRTLEEISRACLEVFHATHDFFALHLVTSSHAFRVCAPYAGTGSGRAVEYRHRDRVSGDRCSVSSSRSPSASAVAAHRSTEQGDRRTRRQARVLVSRAVARLRRRDVSMGRRRVSETTAARCGDRVALRDLIGGHMATHSDAPPFAG